MEEREEEGDDSWKQSSAISSSIGRYPMRDKSLYLQVHSGPSHGEKSSDTGPLIVLVRTIPDILH